VVVHDSLNVDFIFPLAAENLKRQDKKRHPDKNPDIVST